MRGALVAILGVAACGPELPPEPEPVECAPLSSAWVEADGRVNGDVLALAVLEDGTVLTGTQFGIVALDPITKDWSARIDFAAPVTAIAIDPADPLHLLAASQGIHESTDGGRTWQSTLPDPDTGMVAFAPGAPGRAYALLGTRALRSDDAGDTWQVVASDLPGSTTALIVATGDPDAIYAAWNGAQSVGAMGSDDGGATWFETVGLSDVVAAGGMKMYGGSGMTLHRSDDAGRLWTSLPFSGEVVPYAIAVDPGPPEVVYAAGWAGVHASADGGQTWTEWVDYPPIGTPDTMVVGPDGRLLIGAARGSAVLELSDGGEEIHWYGGGISGEGRRLAEPVNGLLYVATTDGVFISGHAGITWGTIASQLPIASPSTFTPTVLVAPSDPAVMYVHYEVAWTDGSAVVSRSDDGGMSWVELGPALAPPAAVDPVSPHLLYVIVDGGLARDDGPGAGLVGVDVGPGRVTGVFPDRDEPEGLLVAVGERVVRIRVRGTIVEDVFVPSRDLAEPRELGTIEGLFTGGDGAIVISYNSGLFVRRELDGEWGIVEPVIDVDLDAAPMTALTEDPSSSRGLFGLTGGRIYRSPDLGTTWCQVETSIGAITGIVAIGGYGRMLIASTADRLYRLAIE